MSQLSSQTGFVEPNHDFTSCLPRVQLFFLFCFFCSGLVNSNFPLSMSTGHYLLILPPQGFLTTLVVFSIFGNELKKEKSKNA